MLISVSGQEDTTTFAYDGDGNRVEKVRTNRWYEERVRFLNDVNLPLVQVAMEIRIDIEGEKEIATYTIGNDLISMRKR